MEIIFLIFVVSLIFGFRKINGIRFDYANIIFWIGIIVCSLLGGGGIAFGFFDWSYFVKPIINEIDLKLFSISALIYASLLFLLTYFLVSGSTQKRWEQYCKQKTSFSLEDEVYFWILFIITVLATFIYFYQMHPSPLYMLLNGTDPILIAERRLELSKHYDLYGSTYIKTLSLLLSQIIFLMSFVRYLNSRGSLSICVFSFLLALMAVIGSGEKAPMINLFLAAMCAVTYMSVKIPRRIFISSIFVLSILFLAFYAAVMGTPLSDLTYKVTERIFVAQVIAVFDSFLAYPDQLSFINLDSLSLPLLDVSREPASSEILTLFYNEMRNWGAWNVNGLYLHEAWANFGYLGLMLSPIYIGLINGLVVKLFFHVRKNTINVALFSFISGNLLYFTTGFNGYLFNLQYIALPCVLIFVWVFCKFTISTIKSNHQSLHNLDSHHIDVDYKS